MSRYTKKLSDNKEFVYGFDHALGIFYELWDYSRGKEDYECIVEDRSYMFNRLSRPELMELMIKYEADSSHIELLAQDLPF